MLQKPGDPVIATEPLVCPDHPAPGSFVLRVLINVLKAEASCPHGGRRRAGVGGSAAAAGPAVMRLVLHAGPAIGSR